MVNSQWSNQNLSLDYDYDHGDLECFSARDLVSCQEESWAAPFLVNKPHEDLPNSPIHGIEGDNAWELINFPPGITSNLPVSVSIVSSIPVSVSSVSIPSEAVVLIHSPLLLTFQMKDVYNPLT